MSGFDLSDLDPNALQDLDVVAYGDPMGADAITFFKRIDDLICGKSMIFVRFLLQKP